MSYAANILINQEGEIIFRTETGRKLWVHNLKKHKGKKGRLEFKPEFNRRSKKQNNYFHLCIPFFAEYIGEELEETKYILKDHFGLYHVKEVFGKRTKVYTSTADLSVGEMVQLTDQIIRLAAILGIVLPDPREYKAEMDTATMIDE